MFAGDLYNTECLQATMKHSGGSLQVWGFKALYIHRRSVVSTTRCVEDGTSVFKFDFIFCSFTFILLVDKNKL